MKKNIYKSFLMLIVTSLLLTSCWENKKEKTWSWVSVNIVSETWVVEENNDEKTWSWFTGVFIDVSNTWDTEEENTEETKDEINFEVEEHNDRWLLERYINNKIWNLKCHFRFEKKWWIIEAVSYINWLRIRSDTDGKFWKNRVKTHMIYDWEYFYLRWTWINLKMKMKKEDLIKESIENARNNEGKELTEEQKKYANLSLKELLEKAPYTKCREWIVEEDMFKVPDDIKFKDMNEKIKELEEFKNIDMNNPKEAIKSLEKLMPEGPEGGMPEGVDIPWIEEYIEKK